MSKKRRTETPRERETGVARLDVLIAQNLEELGYGV